MVPWQIPGQERWIKQEHLLTHDFTIQIAQQWNEIGAKVQEETRASKSTEWRMLKDELPQAELL